MRLHLPFWDEEVPKFLEEAGNIEKLYHTKQIQIISNALVEIKVIFNLEVCSTAVSDGSYCFFYFLKNSENFGKLEGGYLEGGVIWVKLLW